MRHDDLACVRISPGTAYVKGYEFETMGETIDVAKPRSLLSVTTFKGSVHLDIAAGAQSSDISLFDTNDELPLVS